MKELFIQGVVLLILGVLVWRGAKTLLHDRRESLKAEQFLSELPETSDLKNIPTVEIEQFNRVKESIMTSMNISSEDDEEAEPDTHWLRTIDDKKKKKKKKKVL
eukprot:Trichotokara_eunicae@DN8318_c0_g1_i1.p2